MFIGHFGVGFGAKRAAPGVSLGILFLACQLADLIWPNLVLLGAESFRIEPGNTVLTPLAFDHYPYSHSLLALLLWAAVFGGCYAILRRAGARVAIVVALVVTSHWLLDYVTHRPDLPLYPGGAGRFGLGLWNHPAIAVPLELALFGIGAWLYAHATRPLDRRGSIGFWSLVVFLLVVHAANVLGPPPPSVAAVAWSAEAMWLIVFLGFWVDRHRTPAAAPA